MPPPSRANHPGREPGGNRARGPIVIGRDMACDIIISDVSVSRRHACLEVSATQVEIEDLLSKNGTKVDDQPIYEKRVLADGAVLTLGSVVATLHALAGEGQSTMSL
jgi:pSer/pThr/pTyr-binding forkhead associated (FHA) protein